jgi:hypothetical protein
MFLSFFKYTALIYVTLSLGGWIEIGNQNLSSHVAKFNSSFGIENGASGFASWFQREWKDAGKSIQDSMNRNVANREPKVDDVQEDIGTDDSAKLKGLIQGIEKSHVNPRAKK